MEDASFSDTLQHITSTSNLDFVFDEDAYFEKKYEREKTFTSNKHYSLDEAGVLLDKYGNAVMDTNNNPIVIAANENDFTVMPDGTVTTKSSGVIAKIKTVRLDLSFCKPCIDTVAYGTGGARADVNSNEIDFPIFDEFIRRSEKLYPLDKGKKAANWVSMPF